MKALAAAKRRTRRLRLRLRSIFASKALVALGHKKNSAHNKLEKLERWSGRATLWILAGIILEAGVVWYFVEDGREKWLTLTANALIGAGLLIEYVVIIRAIFATRAAERESNEKIAGAEQRAAEANERALKSELELERLKKKVGPRVLPHHDFVQEISDKPKARIQIVFVNGDPDSFSLAHAIFRALMAAKWECSGPQPISQYGDNSGRPAGITVGAGANGIGLVCQWFPISEKESAPVNTLWNAFIKVGLAESLTVSTNEKLPTDMVRIVVAPRL